MYSIVTYHIGAINVNWAAYVISRSIMKKVIGLGGRVRG